MNADQKLALRVSAVAVTCAVFAVTWAAVRPDGEQADSPANGAAVTDSSRPNVSRSAAPRVVVHTRTRAS